MPRLPILSREAFFTKLPNNGGYLSLGFCLVNTSLGAMVEPVSIQAMSTENAGATSSAGVDVYDAAFTKLSELNADEVYRLFNISGLGVLQSYAR